MPTSKPVVIITGVSSGIGQSAAKVFADNGWIVVGTIRNESSLKRTEGLSIDFQTAEMASSLDLERVVQNTVRTYGRIDAVVLNAGYGDLREILKFSYDDMVRQLAVNTLAPAYLLKLSLPYLKKQRGAAVAVSSAAGRAGFRKYSLYSASKFGLEGLIESLYYEFSEVRFRLIEPGPVNSAFWKKSATPKGAISAEDVALTIYRSTISRSRKLRYPLGLARPLALAQRLLPASLFRAVVRRGIRHYEVR